MSNLTFVVVGIFGMACFLLGVLIGSKSEFNRLTRLLRSHPDRKAAEQLIMKLTIAKERLRNDFPG